MDDEDEVPEDIDLFAEFCDYVATETADPIRRAAFLGKMDGILMTQVPHLRYSEDPKVDKLLEKALGYRDLELNNQRTEILIDILTMKPAERSLLALQTRALAVYRSHLKHTRAGGKVVYTGVGPDKVLKVRAR